MTAEKLVERLEHCKATGSGKWLARCPIHLDNSPSLSITEGSDGRVLVHCFAGCGASDVIAAVGLEWSDMFPDDLTQNYKSQYKRKAETVDDLVVQIAKSDIKQGKKLDPESRARYQEALLSQYSRGQA